VCIQLRDSPANQSPKDALVCPCTWTKPVWRHGERQNLPSRIGNLAAPRRLWCRRQCVGLRARIARVFRARQSDNEKEESSDGREPDYAADLSGNPDPKSALQLQRSLGSGADEHDCEAVITFDTDGLNDSPTGA
jgi:hypothetical protein